MPLSQSASFVSQLMKKSTSLVHTCEVRVINLEAKYVGDKLLVLSLTLRQTLQWFIFVARFEKMFAMLLADAVLDTCMDV